VIIKIILKKKIFIYLLCLEFYDSFMFLSYSYCRIINVEIDSSVNMILFYFLKFEMNKDLSDQIFNFLDFKSLFTFLFLFF
jgi:hypothetical protein